MMCQVKGFKVKHQALALVTLFFAATLPALAQTVKLGWNPSPDPNAVGYKIYYGTVSHNYSSTVTIGNTTNTTLTGLINGKTYFFAATTYDSGNQESGFSNEASYAVPLNATNQTPTLNALGNLTINQNAGAQSVALTGITSGSPNENQTLAVIAVSSNPGLIPNPSVTYTSPNTNGSLTFAPVSNVTGKTTITVTVNDGGTSNNIITRSFTVTVNPVNQSPTLDVLGNLTLNQNAGAQSVALTGITSGSPNEHQTLTVTAASSNPALIPKPTITYTSSSTNGSLVFTPVHNVTGSAIISVTVNDGGTSNNIITRSFTVTVNPVNQIPTLNALGNLSINQNAAAKSVALTGITSGSPNEHQTLTVTAASSNPALIPNPSVTYTSPGTNGSLSFTTSSNVTGSAVISVTVNDSGTSNNIITKTFTVTVNPVNQTPTLNALGNLSINQDDPMQTVALDGISSGSPFENQTLSVKAVSSNPTLISNPTVTYASPNASGSLAFIPAKGTSGKATISVTVNDGGTSNNIITKTFTVTVNPVNQPPTLNALGNLTLNQNAAAKSVALTGITSGSSKENQKLTVTAVSSNPALIPSPTVTYTSPSTNGSLVFTPVHNVTGSAIISVTVNDGGTSNNIITKTFTVTVNPVNQTPTLNALGNLTINQNAGAQSVALTGITSGSPNENQTLAVIAVSSNPGLIPNPSVTYTSPNTNGSLTFAPVSNVTGKTTITVTVNDGGTSNNIITRSFTVTVNPVNQSPTLDVLGNLTLNQNAGAQSVALTGITSGSPNEHQTLTVTAASSNPALIPKPTITYTSSSTNGSLVFTPVHNVTGSAIISVTVNDGGTSNNIITRSFTVTVNPVNQIPTLNALGNLSINQNAAAKSVALTGITSGSPNEHQTLTVTAASSNPALIPNPSVTYTSPGTNGSLSFTTSSNVTGSAVISVTVNDSGTSNNIITKTFTVTVNPVNQTPTLNALGNLSINQDDPMQTVALDGISSGSPFENQTLSVKAVSSNPTLISNPTVTYASPNASGSLAFIPAKGTSGKATISVTVNDGGTSNNIITKTFTVTVNPVNQPPTLNALGNLTLNQTTTSNSEDDNAPPTLTPIGDRVILQNAGYQVVSLSGISSGSANENQTLTVKAVSSNPSLIPNPSISYSSPNTTGSLIFMSMPNTAGTTAITVSVTDNGNPQRTVTQTFVVTVFGNPPAIFAAWRPVINQITTQNSATAGSKLVFSVVASGVGPIKYQWKFNGSDLPDQTGAILTLNQLSATQAGKYSVVVLNNFGAVQSAATTLTVAPSSPNTNAGSSFGTQTVALTGITSGSPNEHQTLTVTAVSSNPALIPNPKVTYSSPNTTGSLAFTPVNNASGTASISVTVNDGGATNNTVTKTFIVTINAVALIDQSPTLNTPAKSAALTGITSGSPNEHKTLTITSTSSNPSVTCTSNNIARSFTVTVNPLAKVAQEISISPIIILTPAAYVNGRFSFDVSGAESYPCIVQSSTNLVDWISVETNLIPFTFTDYNADQFARHFYRTAGK